VLAIQIASRFAPPYVMPAPLVIFDAMYRAVTNNGIDIVFTLLRLIASVVASLIAGSLYGMAMFAFAPIRPYLRSLVVIDSGIPALSWMLIAVFWFKHPEARIFFILMLILLPFYAMNVYEGLLALPKDLVEIVESFRPTRLQLFRYLLVPHIVPYLLMTTKSMLGYATRMVVFAELIGASIGIGARMSIAESTFKMDEVLAWTILLVILNVTIQALVSAAERRLMRWRPEVAVR
jgi:NitT/TauT family transport system permease protein